MSLKCNGVAVLAFDPEVKETSAGPVLKFRARFGNGKDKTGNYRDSTFVDCTYFSKGAAKLASHLSKGSAVEVAGKLEPLNQFTKKNGEQGAAMSLMLSELEFLPRDKGDGGGAPQRRGGPTPGDDSYGGYESDDEIPF